MAIHKYIRTGVLKAKSYALTFTAESAGAIATGLTLTNAGDVQIAKDGGSFADATNIGSVAEIGSTGVYKLTLTATEMNADEIVLKVTDGSMDSHYEHIVTDQLPSGSAVTGTLTATAFTTNLPSSTDDFYKDMLIEFRSGSLAGQVKKISDYTGSSKLVTVNDGFTAAPSNGDLFVLVNH